MTNALGIAAVTALLVDRLTDAVVNAVDNAGVKVSAIAPSRFAPEGPIEPGSRLNLFLYRVQRNQGWTNYGQPERNQAGESVANPPLPLDLHYLLSAYGNDNFEAEILLGYGMQQMQQMPVLDRNAIRKSLGGDRVGAGGLLPDGFGTLPADALADQLEMVCIEHHTWSAEDEWRLWEALHAGLRPSATYRASVVLIESLPPSRTPLPVEETQLFVNQLKRPRIESMATMLAAEGTPRPNTPIVRGGRVELRGVGLAGRETQVRFGQGRVDDLAPDDVSPERVVVTVPVALVPGPTSVQLIHRIPKDGGGVITVEVSNSVVVAVQPDFAFGPGAVVADLVVAAGRADGTVVVRFDHPVGVSQRVSLLGNEHQPPVDRSAHGLVVDADRQEPVPSDPNATTDSVTFQVRSIAAVTYLIRVRVDGVDTPLDLAAPTPNQLLDVS